MDNFLFHSTKIYHANKIINDDVMYGDYPRSGALINYRGIFTTRSLHHAKYVYGNVDTAILVLNKTKLSCRFKIKPVRNYTGDFRPMSIVGLGGQEFEEFIFTDKIEMINDYIEDVIV